MMIGANIKRLRLEHAMTQKNLADRLFVSAQAVSRWENDEVEPSISTILELAKIFGVTADEILGFEIKEEQKMEHGEESKDEDFHRNQECYRQFLAVCEQCNSPIYESSEIVRSDGTVLCTKCHQKKEEERLANERRSEEERRRSILEDARQRRNRSFLFGTLACVVFLIVAFSMWGSTLQTVWGRIGSILWSLSMFTFVSCCILNNNFVGELFISIAMWSFKAPGLIFTFDLDGCLWFIGMKILFAILGFFVGVVAFLLALLVGCFVSIFAYPYAIVTNIKHPEKTEF